MNYECYANVSIKLYNKNVISELSLNFQNVQVLNDFFLVMWMGMLHLWEHTVTFECSLNVLKQVVSDNI